MPTLGRMVEQNRSGTYSEIVYAPTGAKLAIMNGSTIQKAFVPLTGGSMAVYNSSGLAYYRHSDWLGSSRFASTPTRTMYYDGAYGPFGEPYAQSGTADLSFTGMNQDTVSNLYDFPAREYGIQGRWPSPDPSGLSSTTFTDPQTSNLYAYVRNSPLSAIDPDGLNCVWDDGSYDDASGPDTSTEEGCASLGGSWIPQVTGDWNPNPNQSLADLVSSIQDSYFVYVNATATNGDPNSSPCYPNDKACNAQLQQILCDGPCISGFAQQALGQAGQMSSPVAQPGVIVCGYAVSAVGGFFGGVAAQGQALAATQGALQTATNAALQYGPTVIEYLSNPFRPMPNIFQAAGASGLTQQVLNLASASGQAIANACLGR